MSIIHVEDRGRQASDGHNTRVCFLLDETGSMSVAKSQVISGFNEYIQTLQTKTDDVLLTLVKFNSVVGIDTVYSDKPIADVPKLGADTYRPDGMTPLYDAIGATISRMSANNDQVLFVIQTDGEENASREYVLDAVKQLIETQEKIGWTFVYMGADQNAWEVGGKSLGLSRGNTMDYGSAKTRDTFTNLANATVSYCFDESKSKGVTGFFSDTGGN